MSLVGIDIGTSAIKVAAFSTSGICLASAREPVAARRERPGQWEVDPADSLRACKAGLARVSSHPEVQRDPPVAVSFSSSGREIFPAAADGRPLGMCVMAADHRGDDVARRTLGMRRDEEWFLQAGHIPRRMDPINRIRWWQEAHPEVVSTARWFLNWHEYYTLLMTGQVVTDLSGASTWATFDLGSLTWSKRLVEEIGIDPAWLPEPRRSGSPVGTITPSAAADFSLPVHTLVVTGAWDLIAAAIGQGAVGEGTLGLTAGSWHSFCLPAGPPWSTELGRDGASLIPHPGDRGFAVGMFDPNGMSVVDWALRLFGVSEGRLNALLAGQVARPSPVCASPTLSDLPEQHTAGGTLSCLRLSTSAVDIVQSLLEGISTTFANRVSRLRSSGYGVDVIRASGGGAKLRWLMQLHADLTGIPVEVVADAEPGALGAAILAGVGVGAYQAVDLAVRELVRTGTRFEPCEERRCEYAELLEVAAHSPSKK